MVALAFPDGRCITREGHVEGSINHEPAGKGGFGYDPIFLLPQHGLTLAEIGEEEKNLLSHRGNAIRAILPDLLGAFE